MKVENQRIDSISSPNSSSRAGPVLGGAEDVEDPAPDRELPALLNLLDALVAGLDQELGDVAEVDLRRRVSSVEARRAQRRVGHRLGERHGAGDDHGGSRSEVGRARPAPPIRRPTRWGGGATCEA